MWNKIDVEVGKKLFWTREGRDGLIEAKEVSIEKIYKDGSFKVSGFMKPSQSRFKSGSGWPWAQSGSGQVREIEDGETIEDLRVEIAEVRVAQKAKKEEKERKAQQRFQDALKGTKDYTMSQVDKFGDETTYKIVTLNEKDNHRYLVIFSTRPHEYYDWEQGKKTTGDPIVKGLRVSVSYRNTEEKNFNNWGSCSQFDAPNLENAIEQIRAHIWGCW